MATPENPLFQFELALRAGLEQVEELIELGMYDEPRPLDPYSLDVGTQVFEEMTPDQLEVSKRTIFEAMGIDGPYKEPVRRYETDSLQGEQVAGGIKATVYQTKYDGMYVQELVWGDGLRQWVLGPNINI